MIEAESLTKKFGSLTAIHKISFRAEPGEIVGLLGHNGAGKTTTMRILAGYMPPTSGAVRIVGYDMLNQPLEAKRQIGYLPEVPPLYPELTVTDSIRFVAGLFKVREMKRQVERALEKAGLTDVRHRLISTLSKGYRQRVGIAQAIVHQPRVLILDEPTIGLDPKQIIEIRELLKSLKGDQVILLSSHILQEVAAVCDRLLIINRGEVVADGKLEELSKNLKQKRLLITVSGDPVRVRAEIEKIPGVVEVADHGSDLEAIFLSLTKPSLTGRND